MTKEFEGKWIYRSLLNDSNIETEFNDLRFGAGTLILKHIIGGGDGQGVLTGTLGGNGWSLDMVGRVEKGKLIMKGEAINYDEKWVYEYQAFLTPTWNDGVDQKKTFTGTVIRTIQHGDSPAGVTASFYAVEAESSKSTNAKGKGKSDSSASTSSGSGSKLNSSNTKTCSCNPCHCDPCLCNLAVRKNVTSLSKSERKRFVDAVIGMKKIGLYDTYVRVHLEAMSSIGTPDPTQDEPSRPSFRNAAHNGPVFLPWHREFLRRFEIDLQAVDKELHPEAKEPLTIPYWDWTEAIDHKQSRMWDADFMGGDGSPHNGYIVQSGRFAHSTGNWSIVGDDRGPELRRSFGVVTETLPTASDLAIANRAVIYDSPPWNGSRYLRSFRNLLEGWVLDGFNSEGTQLHNKVHVWVGQTMLQSSSPNDPVFWLHHCMVDKIWADWQNNQPGPLSESYQPVSTGPVGHRLNDAMWPWNSNESGQNVSPLNVLNHHTLGYKYDTDVGKSSNHSHTHHNHYTVPQ